MKIQKRYQAFTLIEMIIVMAIISILSLASFFALRNARSTSQFKATQRQVASTIKLAQSYSLQGKLQEYPIGSGTFVSPCGYGFRFKNGTDYEIFYNLPEGPGLDCATKNAASTTTYKQWMGGGLPAGSGTTESFSLKNGVTLDPTSQVNAEIYFTLPHANIFDTNGVPFINVYPSGSPLEMKFRFGTTTKSVFLDSGGFVME